MFSLECNQGKYGYNCTEHCGHCYNSSCNPVNGSCLTGCKPGYYGNLCQQGKRPHYTLKNVYKILLSVFEAMRYAS